MPWKPSYGAYEVSNRNLQIPELSCIIRRNENSIRLRRICVQEATRAPLRTKKLTLRTLNCQLKIKLHGGTAP